MLLLSSIFDVSGILSHSDLDERALDALKEFPVEGGVQVLKQFAESNLEHVGNKSAYLCGVMKTYRQKNKMPGGAVADAGAKKGPDEVKLKASNCSCLSGVFVISRQLRSIQEETLGFVCWVGMWQMVHNCVFFPVGNIR